MTVQEAMDYINAHTWSQWKLGLSRTRDLLALLGNPQKNLRFVHVAGSNGKGSTCAMLERILREAGYVTGFYPSPYIEDFRERIQVCGDLIPEEALCRITERVRELADGMEDHPTQFELITAIGMVWFAEKKCDLVVLEVGLGGRFDSTNVIDAPEAAVITNIGLEHTEYLGNSLAEIASNKCGIIKPGTDVVCYENLPEVMEVVTETCAAKGCPLHLASFDRIRPLQKSLWGQSFLWKSGGGKNKGGGSEEGGGEEANYQLSLLGDYQLHNAATVLTTVEVLRKRGFAIPEEAVHRGLSLVSWPARFEVLSHSPLFILDGGHNPQCASALAGSLRTCLPARGQSEEPDKADRDRSVGLEGWDKDGGGTPGTVFLMGMLADKDYRTVIDIVSPFAVAFVCLTPDSPRALPAEDLAEELRGRGFTASVCGTAEEGIREALRLAGEPLGPASDPLPVVAFGSLYMAGQVRSAFRRLKKEIIAHEKTRQRREALRRRRSLPEAAREKKSSAVCGFLEDLPALRQAKTVFSYAAAPDEVNTDAINSFLRARGKEVCFPVCGRGGTMEALVPAPGDPDAWRTGAWGIREPVPEKSAPIRPDRIDAVIVPCVAFDRRGGRCGHGAGYYDRYLARLAPGVSKILVAFDAQEMEAVAEEETDVRMDMIVTETGLLTVHLPENGGEVWEGSGQ